MWIARRSDTKATDPGMLDNVVAGGIGWGFGIEATIIKECWEEAGITRGDRRARRGGPHRHVLQSLPEGTQAEQIFIFDLALPADFAPRNQDGEVGEHRLARIDEVARWIEEGAMTVDASLATLDCLLRRRWIDEDACAGIEALFVPPDRLSAASGARTTMPNTLHRTRHTNKPRIEEGSHQVMSTDHSFILKLSCADRPGIVHAVSGFLFSVGSNILDSAQFGDSHTGEFFMRVHFQQVGGDPGLEALRTSFTELAEQFGMRWELHDASVKPRVVIMVSKIGHCLNDLLFRYRTGQLRIEIPAIISNHKDFYQLAASYDIPFHHSAADVVDAAGEGRAGSARAGDRRAA